MSEAIVLYMCKEMIQLIPPDFLGTQLSLSAESGPLWVQAGEIIQFRRGMRCML